MATAGVQQPVETMSEETRKIQSLWQGLLSGNAPLESEKEEDEEIDKTVDKTAVFHKKLDKLISEGRKDEKIVQAPWMKDGMYTEIVVERLCLWRPL